MQPTNPHFKVRGLLNVTALVTKSPPVLPIYHGASLALVRNLVLWTLVEFYVVCAVGWAFEQPFFLNGTGYRLQAECLSIALQSHQLDQEAFSSKFFKVTSLREKLKQNSAWFHSLPQLQTLKGRTVR